MKISKRLFSTTLLMVITCIISSCGDDDIEIETETNISYTLTISPDLLKFVTPQVSYVDENGNLVTLTGVEDLDGKVIGDSSWTSIVISGTGYKCWTMQMKFKHLGFHSHMTVKYLRNDFVEDTAGKVYNFHHDVFTSIKAKKITKSSKGLDSVSYSDSHMSITLVDYHYGDNIETYLKSLYDTPDRVGYYINENGDVNRKDEFE